MKQGKISETVCKRSVLKYVKKNHEEIKSGAGQQSDCAIFSCQTVTFPITETVLIRHAVHAAVNDLAVQGCMAGSVLLSVTLPERVRESKLSQMMSEAERICSALGIRMEGGHTLVSDSVLCPVVTVTAGGRRDSLICVRETPQTGADLQDEQIPAEMQRREEQESDGCDLVLTKYVAMEGAALIADAAEGALLARFPRSLVEEVKGFEGGLSVLPEAVIAAQAGAKAMQDVREGGIFGALWELAQRCGKGLQVDLKKIPMKQSVVEICNYYDLNPYEMLSTGCLLIAAADGEALAQQLHRQGIAAAVIGRLTEGNDRVIRNGDEIRYLDLPKPDQIRKVLNMEQQGRRHDASNHARQEEE